MTGTTGYLNLEQHMTALAASDQNLNLLIQSPNTIAPLPRVKSTDHIDMDTYDTSGFDVMVGHCGAGTAFWALERNLPLIAIVDLDRHDDHQLDLGNWLAKHEYALVLINTPPSLVDLNSAVSNRFRVYKKSNFEIDALLQFFED